MNWTKKREYRVLALSIVFFAAGLGFFIADRNAGPSSVMPSAAGVSGGAGAAGAADGSLANDPAPSSFRTFTFDGQEINGTTSFALGAACTDAYVAVLVFPSSADYRENVSRAVYNHAFPCANASDGAISVALAPGDLGSAPSGTYYYFTADQGTSGVWYNPK
jgi:hypothetical protein